MHTNSQLRRVAFVTLGCAKNEVDTNRMVSLVEASPLFECVADVDEADVVVVNTCSFLVSAVEEGIETTLALLGERCGSACERPIVMTGCIPSRYGDEIAREIPEVSAYVPITREDEIVSVLERVAGLEPAPFEKPSVLRTVESAVAYVKISDGCDRFCSFCAIPYIRGRYYSRPQSVIVDEVRHLVAGGVREIVLIGQDTGIWGSDLPGAPGLSDLLRAVAHELEAVDGWVRVLYLQPEGLTQELVAAIRDIPQVVKYIDMPLQHASATVLSRMNRTGSASEFLETVKSLRAAIPGVTLRTTAMVGFPGETDEEFEELVDFLEQAAFDYCAVFSYSQEEGTAAAELPDQVEPSVKLEREQRVIDVSEAFGFASAALRIGQTHRVLIDSVEEDGCGGAELIGRAAFQAPDSDGVVHLSDAEAAMGEFVSVRFDDAACYELFGEIVHPEEM